MRYLVRAFVALSISLVLSCNDDNGVGPPIEPPGRQHDIPWPSLADSPWPMHHGNPQSTGRSRYVGPASGQVEWILDIGAPVSTSIVLGPDSTVYFFSSYEGIPQRSFLYAVKPDGRVKWKVQVAQDTVRGTQLVETTPLIAADGTIYVGTPEGILFALAPDGKVKWNYRAGGAMYNIGMSIGLDGTLYFVADDGYLYAVEGDGALKWKLSTASGFAYWAPNGIAFSPDGLTLYVGGGDGSATLYAVGVEGAIKWSFDVGMPIKVTPMVDSDGNVYIDTSSGTDTSRAGFYSLDQVGSVRWRYPGTSGGSYEPTIDADGNIYIIRNVTDLVALDVNGNARWRFLGPGLSPAISLVCDVEGTVYIAGYNVSYAIRSDGSLKSQTIASESVNSPALASDGTLYIGSWFRGKKLYAIR